MGRWLSRDPILETGGIDLYRYAWNSPVNFRDSLGLDPYSDLKDRNSSMQHAAGALEAINEGLTSELNERSRYQFEIKLLNTPFRPGKIPDSLPKVCRSLTNQQMENEAFNYARGQAEVELDLYKINGTAPPALDHNFDNKYRKYNEALTGSGNLPGGGQ